MANDVPGGWDPPPRDPWGPPAVPGHPPAGGQPGQAWAPPGPAWQAPQPPSGYAVPPGGGWAPPPSGGNARTGPLPLQPMGVGEILDGAFRLYRANIKPIALVALVVMGPLQLVAAVAARGQFGGGSPFDVLNDPSLTEEPTSPFADLGPQLLTLATALLGFLIGPIVAGAVAKAVAVSYLGGELTAGEALRAALRRAWPLVSASVLVHLTEGVGLLGCCIGAVFVMGFWVVVSPAIVVEELGPLQGMRRSWELCTSRYWQVLGVAVLSGIITTVLSQIVSGVFAVPAGIIGFDAGFPLLAIGGILTAVFVAPISAIVATLVYFDLRIRREGFDLQVMASELARTPG